MMSNAEGQNRTASPSRLFGTEGKGGVLRDWNQGDVVRVKVINLDNHVHYYRNVDFSAQFSKEIRGSLSRLMFIALMPAPETRNP